MTTSTSAQLVVITIVVGAICVLAINDRLNGEAGAMLGSIVGYLINNVYPRAPSR